MAAESEIVSTHAGGNATATRARRGAPRRVSAVVDAGVEPSSSPTLASRLVLLLLCAAIVLSTIAYGAVSPWALAFFQASACLVVLLWAWDAFASGGLRVSRNPLQIPLFALVAIGVAQITPFGGATVSLDPFQTLIATIKTLALSIYFAAALAFIDRPSRLRFAARIVIVFGFVLAITGMVQSFVSPDSIYGIQTPNQAYPFGPFVNRHHFANYMLMALALPLGLLFAGAVRREQRLLTGFAAALMGVALVATGSRGAMLSFVVQIAFLVVAAGSTARAGDDRSGDKAVRPSAGRAWLLRAGAGALALSLVLVGVLTLGGEEGLTRLVGSVNSADPTTGRTHFWAVTLQIIEDHPLLGAGLGAFGTAYARHDSRDGTYRVEQAHNDYLQLLSDAGIVGGLFGLMFVVVLYRVGARRLRSADVYRRGVALGALAACTGALAHGVFEFALHTTSNALLFLVLAAFATLGAQVEEPPAPKRRRRRAAADASHDDQPEQLPARATVDAHGGRHTANTQATNTQATNIRSDRSDEG